MLKKTKFVIQEHHSKGGAGHHWDLRIMKDRTLKSWAIPKHKFPKKGEKLRAVQVPDHPLWWGNWEGTIKSGYGRGTVKIYDKGECIVDKWTDSSIRFEVKGTKLKGRFALVHMGEGKDWLLIRSK